MQILEKSLGGKIRDSVSKCIIKLSSDGASMHVNWVTTNPTYKVLAALPAMLYQEPHPVVTDLLNLVHQSAWEIRAHVNWIADYSITPMHFLRRLTLGLNIWQISDEEDSGDISIIILSEINFELERRTSGTAHISDMSGGQHKHLKHPPGCPLLQHQ